MKLRVRNHGLHGLNRFGNSGFDKNSPLNPSNQWLKKL